MIKHDMPNAEYHAHKAFSKSTLHDFHVAPTPAHFQTRTPLDSPALAFGSACHAAILEPHVYNNDVVTPPADVLSKSGARSGKAWYSWKADQDADGKIIITESEKRDIEYIQEAVFQLPENREAAELLTGGLSEVSFFWDDWETSLPAKCRPDKLPGSEIIVDLKTAKCAAPEAFARDVAAYKYAWSVVLTCDGVTECTSTLHRDYRFVVVEKTPPYGCMVYRIDPTEIELYRIELEQIKKRYAYCVANNSWPSYPDGTHQLNIPTWDRKKLEISLYD